MVYNKNNELLQKDSSEFTYDDNGNTISKTVADSVTNYSYDIDNRLLSVEEDGVVVGSYYYDPFGRRLWKDVNGTKTYFHYADEGLVAEADGLGAVVKSYGYVPNSTWTTDPLFMTEGGKYYFYQNDHLGTPQKLTSVTGAVVWSSTYEAFGKASVTTDSTLTNNLRFAGQYYDDETGLHYNWNRHYNPVLGRYVTPDPIGLNGGINFYSYVHDNPIRFIDPKGLDVIAYCTYTTAGEVLGGGGLQCTLKETLCLKGKRREAQYTGFFGGATFGAPAGRVKFSMTFSTADDVRSLAGKASIVAHGAAFPWGKTWGKTCLGNHCSIGSSSQVGIDLSADFFQGYGFVHNIKEKCCD